MIDELTQLLHDLGRHIADRGCGGTPALERLAIAAHSAAPVPATVLASDDEPEVVRCRAFLAVGLAAARLDPAEQMAIVGVVRGWAPPLAPSGGASRHAGAGVDAGSSLACPAVAS